MILFSLQRDSIRHHNRPKTASSVRWPDPVIGRSCIKAIGLLVTIIHALSPSLKVLFIRQKNIQTWRYDFDQNNAQSLHCSNVVLNDLIQRADVLNSNVPNTLSSKINGIFSTSVNSHTITVNMIQTITLFKTNIYLFY